MRDDRDETRSAGDAMSHKDVPARSPEQERMEGFWDKLFARTGTTIGWGRDKDGNYLSNLAAACWAAWKAAGSAYSDEVFRQQFRIVELNDFISAQRIAISDLLNTIEQLRQHIEDGETDEALALIATKQQMASPRKEIN